MHVKEMHFKNFFSECTVMLYFLYCNFVSWTFNFEVKTTTTTLV